MAVNFGNKNKGKQQTETEAPSKTNLPSWMKKGKAAQKALEDEKEQQDKKYNKIWRFWLPNDAETKITFLDGNLDSDGMLDCLMWHEHQLQIAGSWQNWFTCVKEEEPCPLCEQNESRMVAGFTIIDHSAFNSKKSGVIKDTLKLFICKQETLKMLQKIATKRGGLAGCSFDVSRSGDNSAGCGNMFDFIEKKTLAELQKQYGTKDKIIQPYNLLEVIEYKDAAQLRAEGFGTPPIGSEANYNDQL